MTHVTFLRRIGTLREIRVFTVVGSVVLVDIAAGCWSGFSSLGVITPCRHTGALYNSQYILILDIYCV